MTSFVPRPHFSWPPEKSSLGTRLVGTPTFTASLAVRSTPRAKRTCLLALLDVRDAINLKQWKVTYRLIIPNTHKVTQNPIHHWMCILYQNVKLLWSSGHVHVLAHKVQGNYLVHKWCLLDTVSCNSFPFSNVNTQKRNTLQPPKYRYCVMLISSFHFGNGHCH